MWIEPIFKRAIKYLIELICIESAKSNRPRPRVSRTDALFSMETAVICAENMVNLAQNSERVHSVTPDEALVRIFFGDRSLDYEITAEGTSSGFDRELGGTANTATRLWVSHNSIITRLRIKNI
jgi:hypothetical protein